MNNQGLRYIVNDQKHLTTQRLYSQKTRQTYISPNKEVKAQIQRDSKHFNTSPARFHKNQTPENRGLLPPRAAPFKRTHNQSLEKKEKDRIKSQSIEKVDEQPRDILRFSVLRKKLQEQIKQRQRWQQLSSCQLLKIENLTQQTNKLRGQKKQLEKVILELQKSNQQININLVKSQQNAEQLTRNLKETRINQKSLINLKNLQNQLELLTERNKKLTAQNEYVAKQNRGFKLENDKLFRERTEDSQSNSKGDTEVKRLLGQLQKQKSQRQRLLEMNLHQLEKKLYEAQNQLKKVHIQLNCIDRKKTLSIDEVKTKKDQQLKDLRQKFMKVTKDLRQTRDKIQKNERKKPKQNPFLRKYKSSKNLGFNSQSEVTFEFSQES